MDTLGHWLALHVTPARRDNRVRVGHLAAAIQDTTDGSIGLACIDRAIWAKSLSRQCGHRGLP
ncbi:transposase IS4 family protein [Komagataeibacter xylinus E25]|nr:transposase IS4 family protein [Komagataeibacter xylinus E25]